MCVRVLSTSKPEVTYSTVNISHHPKVRITCNETLSCKTWSDACVSKGA